MAAAISCGALVNVCASDSVARVPVIAGAGETAGSVGACRSGVAVVASSGALINVCAVDSGARVPLIAGAGETAVGVGACRIVVAVVVSSVALINVVAVDSGARVPLIAGALKAAGSVGACRIIVAVVQIRKALVGTGIIKSKFVKPAHVSVIDTLEADIMSFASIKKILKVVCGKSVTVRPFVICYFINTRFRRRIIESSVAIAVCRYEPHRVGLINTGK